MEKYTILLYETLKQAVEVKADNEEDAIDQVRAWRAQGMLKPGELAGLDFDMLDVQPLRDEPLQRFEILGQPALFMASGNGTAEKQPQQAPKKGTQRQERT